MVWSNRECTADDAVAANPAPAGSYVEFPLTDISGTWCISPFGLPYNQAAWIQSDGSFFSLDVMMTLCEGLTGCNGFNPGGWTRSFLPNTTVNSFISNTTCGTGLTASLSSGTAISPPGTQYLVCTAKPGYAVDNWFEIYNEYALPPFMIQTACDKDPRCAAYMVAVDGSKGWLIQYAQGDGFSEVHILLSSRGGK